MITGRWGYGTRIERLDKAQWEGVNIWRQRGARGTLEWHTGVGKTHGFFKGYTAFRVKFPTEPIHVVVPTTVLKDSWEAHIKERGLVEVEVYVINTYITQPRKCKLLVIDEVHRVLGEEAEHFNKCIDVCEFDFFLGLSATLRFEEKETLSKRGLPIVHTITEFEAREEGFTSDYIEYNLAVPLNHIEQEQYDTYSSMHDKNQRFFVIDDVFDFKLAMACTRDMEKCKKVAAYRNWTSSNGEDHPDAPKNIKNYANMWLKGMTGRKNVLYNALGKIDVTVNLIKKFDKALIITFSQSSEMADAITKKIPDIAMSYHTKIKGAVVEDQDLFGGTKTKVKLGADKVKKRTLELFKQRKIRAINAVKALDEGVDVPQIDMSIITSGSSKERQQKQRKGRSTRYDHSNTEKKSIIVNLYCPNTQDERWLKERQGRDANVTWIKDYNKVGYAESEDFRIGG